MGNYQQNEQPAISPSNGVVEAAVKVAKTTVKKNSPKMALLACRNTPVENGFSPTDIMYERKVSDNFPSTWS